MTEHDDARCYSCFKEECLDKAVAIYHGTGASIEAIINMAQEFMNFIVDDDDLKEVEENEVETRKDN